MTKFALLLDLVIFLYLMPLPSAQRNIQTPLNCIPAKSAVLSDLQIPAVLTLLPGSFLLFPYPKVLF